MHQLDTNNEQIKVLEASSKYLSNERNVNTVSPALWLRYHDFARPVPHLPVGARTWQTSEEGGMKENRLAPSQVVSGVKRCPPW